jgi:DNA replication factor GINS
MMDLEELRGVQAGERSTDSLQPLRDSFYREVAEYIDGLREERARAAERADDPFGSEAVRHLTDEIETAQEVAEAIYDRRLGKVVKRASLAAAGMPTDDEGLTDEEVALFGAVVEEIESRRSAVLSAFAGEGELSAVDALQDSDAALDGAGGSDSGNASGERPTPGASDAERRSGDASTPGSAGDADERVDPDPGGTPPETRSTPGEPPIEAAGDAGLDASEAMGGGAAPEPPRADASDGTPPTGERSGADPPGEDRSGDAGEDGHPDAEGATPDGGRLAADRATVRITTEVGEIMGVDEHVYDLADGDVVTLPSANAEPLLERDAASRIDR